MIQRIQSVYLLLAAVLHGLLYWVGLASFTGLEATYTFRLTGLSQNTKAGVVSITGLHPVWMILLNAVIILFIFYVILQFKKRMMQMRLCGFAMLMVAGLLALITFSFDTASGIVAEKTVADGQAAEVMYGLGFLIPVISMILIFLAISGIKKDEALVRSADRIR
jgi:amino acid transporter